MSTAPARAKLDDIDQCVRDRIAKVRDVPQGRLELRREFYRLHGGSGFRDLPIPHNFGFGNSELAFLHWEIHRGVLNSPGSDQPGSPWWRGVNEDYIYISEYSAVAYEARIDEAELHPENVLWYRYFEEPSAESWYRAHNGSVVRGYLNRIAEAKNESRAERLFMNRVLYRVLFAQLLAESGHDGQLQLRIFHPLSWPQLPAVDGITHVPAFYPKRYPIEQVRAASPKGFRKKILNKAKGLATRINAEVGDALSTELDDLLVRLQVRSLADLYKQCAAKLYVPELMEFSNGDESVYPVRVSSTQRLVS